MHLQTYSFPTISNNQSNQKLNEYSNTYLMIITLRKINKFDKLLFL